VSAALKWLQNYDEVIKVGGLHIVGTERNESRRVDNQLRGRSGRQGDVGSTRFYLSLKDNLMRIFASEKMAVMMQRLGMEKGEAIAPIAPALAIICASRSCCLAFKTSCLTFFCVSSVEIASEFSILLVPTKTGCPVFWQPSTSVV
jgi:hypothetical protein